jgi:hypothetical protein
LVKQKNGACISDRDVSPYELLNIWHMKIAIIKE